MSEKMCRVCHEEENIILKSPCKCTGSIKYICIDCLNKSIESNGYYCTICTFPFKYSIINKNIVPNWVFIWFLYINIYISYISTLLIFSPPIFYYINYIYLTQWSFGHLTLYYLSEIVFQLIINSMNYNITFEYYFLFLQYITLIWHVLFISNINIAIISMGVIICFHSLKIGIINFSNWYKKKYISISFD